MDHELIKNWIKENLNSDTLFIPENLPNESSMILQNDMNETIKYLQENYDLKDVSLKEVVSGKKFLRKIRKRLQREIHDWTLSPYLEKQTFVNHEIISQINIHLKILQKLESSLESLDTRLVEIVNSKISEQKSRSVEIHSQIKKIYFDLLEHTIDSDAFDYYFSEIQNDRLTTVQLKEIIKNSEEYKQLIESKEILQKYQSRVKKPIFIFGVPRTGTTLLQSILCSNDKLAWFSDQDIGDWLSLEEQHQHYSFSQWLKSNNKNIPASEQTLFALGKDLGSGIKHLGIPPKGSSKIPIEGEIFWKKYLGWAYIKDISMDTKILLAKEISQIIKKQGKERFISKAPNNSIRLFALEKLFPDAKFINVTRDPRQVVSSMITRYEEEGIFQPGIPIKNKMKYEGLEFVEKFAWLYKEITDAIYEFSKVNKNNFMTVRYEELISNPNEVVKKIFQFSDLDIPDNVSDFIPKLHDTSKKWKKKLSPDNEKQIFNILDTTIQKMDYPYSL